MISAGRHEQRTGKLEQYLVEPKPLVIEARGRLEIAHEEMHVADARAAGIPFHATPWLARTRSAAFERERRHLELVVGNSPRLARTIGIHLDPETVRIGEIHRLAHE